MSLKAPYNFVPLSKTVVNPHWANYVSHDLPFDNAQSGHLDMELVAESPLYVRNGTLKGELDTEKSRFNHHQNRYFIPGSSLKGMLRSVLEVISFGRISDKIDNVTLAQRDFSNPTIYEKEKFAKEIQCGWLRKVGDDYQLKDCGRPGRITHEALSSIARSSTGQTISDYYRQNLNFNDKYVKSAKSKYELFVSQEMEEDLLFEHVSEKNNPLIKKYILSDAGSNKGRIVMTGQPAKVNPNAGKGMAKHSEFAFFTSSKSFEPIDPQIIRNLKVAFFDGEKNESLDWKWRKEQLDNGLEIPVFFRKEGGKVKDMGLSFLYKMAYEYSTKQLANQNEGQEVTPDLADTVFGYVDSEHKQKDKSQRALKGRVQIGHAFAEGEPIQMEVRNDVLAGPKPTYYPTYIRQEGNGEIVSKYATYNNEHARISGWKRYPIRTDGSVNTNGPQAIKGVVNANISSAFVPLNAGATFRFRINYHNLRREELGALISAITFHNTPDTYHSLGLAKPLGYGKVSLKILNLEADKLIEYQKAFEGFMRSEVPTWYTSEQLQELVAMAQPKATTDKTKYMELAGFKEAKDKKLYLQKHSQIYTLARVLKPLLTDTELSELKAFYADEKKQFVVIDAEQLLQGKKKEKTTGLETLKRTWRDMISSKQKAVKQAEDDADRQHKSQKAIEGGPELTDVQVPHKDPLDRMNNEIRKYGAGLPGGSIPKKDKEILEKFPQGYVLETHHTLIIDHFKALYQHLSDREKVSWKKGNSEARKYLRQWIGLQKADEVFSQLA